ncbi:MAG: MFS transporter [Chloroflexota bacterium]
MRSEPSSEQTQPLSRWQVNLGAAVLSQMLAALGFALAFPFIPLYVQELGVSDPRAVEWWAGILGFAGGLSMALFAPLWGTLADRYGRKPMLLRAMLGGALLLGSMGLVRSVEELLVLRFFQGALTGTLAATTALVAAFVPRRHLGLALGLVQVSVYCGFALGPLVGGLIADAVGYRYTFFLTSIMLALGGATVLFFVEERFQPLPHAAGHGGAFAGLGSVLRQPTFLALTGVVFAIQGSEMMVIPLLPLYVQGLTPSGGSVPTTVGLILGASAAASALSALILGRWSDRLGYRRLLALCTLGGGLAYLPIAWSVNTTQVLLLQVAVGVFVGGMLPAANALIALAVPRASQGAAFGLTQTAAALAGALGPLAGAALATQLGIRSIFVATGALLLAAGLTVALRKN